MQIGGLFKRRDAAFSLGEQKGFLHLKAPKGLMTLSCSETYIDTKTVCFKNTRVFFFHNKKNDFSNNSNNISNRKLKVGTYNAIYLPS